MFKPNDVDFQRFADDDATPEELRALASGFDTEGFGLAEDEFFSKLTSEQTEFILNNVNPDRTPTENLYHQGQKLMEKYWEIPKQFASGNQLRMYEQFQRLPAAEQKAFALRNPMVRVIDSQVQDQLGS